MKLEDIQEYLDSALIAWALTTVRVDTSYEPKTKIGKNIHGNDYVGVYKVGYMGGINENGDDELTWNFTFSITVVDNGFELGFFLDDTEENIMRSLDADGYKFINNHWMREYHIPIKTFKRVREFLNKHVWQYDLGYFY